jgi:hypothetical protein
MPTDQSTRAFPHSQSLRNQNDKDKRRIDEARRSPRHPIALQRNSFFRGRELLLLLTAD